MACTLSNSGIATGLVIRAAQVSQSVDAFTKGNAYDITLSGSLVITGSVAFSSSEAFDFNIKGLSCISQTHLLNYNCSNGTVSFIEASSVIQQPSVSPYYTASVAGKEILPLGGNNVMGCSPFSVIAGGCTNEISTSTVFNNNNVVGGGNCNLIIGNYQNQRNVIGGGSRNCIIGYKISNNVIGGGAYNNISNDINLTDTFNTLLYNTINGGFNNCILGGNFYSTILGGACNNIISCTTLAQSNMIINGRDNCIEVKNSLITLYNNIIGAGSCNTINDDYATLTGGGNIVTSNFIGGGSYNTGSCNNGFIAAGECNHLKHNDAFILGSNISSVAECTVHVNNLNVGCTTQMQLRNPIGTGAAGMLVACDAGGGTAELYFHDGSTYKKVCLVP